MCLRGNMKKPLAERIKECVATGYSARCPVKQILAKSLLNNKICNRYSIRRLICIKMFL